MISLTCRGFTLTEVVLWASRAISLFSFGFCHHYIEGCCIWKGKCFTFKWTEFSWLAMVTQMDPKGMPGQDVSGPRGALGWVRRPGVFGLALLQQLPWDNHIFCCAVYTFPPLNWELRRRRHSWPQTFGMLQEQMVIEKKRKDPNLSRTHVEIKSSKQWSYTRAFHVHAVKSLKSLLPFFFF